MKKAAFYLIGILILSACSVVKPSGMLQEDELFMTRKFAGNFIEYRHSGPDHFGSPHLIWIKTSKEDTFGKICAYSRRCEFTAGERLFIRRIYYAPSVTSGYWMYQLEGDAKHYRLRQFQIDRKILVQGWF